MLIDTITFVGGADWNYDIAGYTLSKPANDAIIGRFRCARAFNIPTNASGSIMNSGVAATGSTTYLLKKNGTQFGTCAFSASGTTGTFTVTSTNFAIGDELTIVAPASADATHDEISWTLVTNSV